MIRRAALFAASCLALAGPADAAITMVAEGGYNSAGSGSTTSGAMALSANIAATELAVVMVYNHNNAGTVSVTDSCGDTFSSLAAQTAPVGGLTDKVQVFYTNPSCTLVAGTGTITAILGTSEVLFVAVAKITGQASSSTDQQAVSSGTTTAATPISSPPTVSTPAQASEMAIGEITQSSAGADTAPTQTGYTALGAQTAGVGQRRLDWGWQLLSSTASISYQPTPAVSSRNYITTLHLFKVGVSAAGAPTSLLLMGVGE